MYTYGCSKNLLLCIHLAQGFFQIGKKYLGLFQMALSQGIISLNPQNSLAPQNFLCICWNSLSKRRIWYRFSPCDCEFCTIGNFNICLNEEFLRPWADRVIQVTKNLRPTFKEELQANIADLLDTYRHSQLFPFFVMYVIKDCDSPSIAIIT